MVVSDPNCIRFSLPFRLKNLRVCLPFDMARQPKVDFFSRHSYLQSVDCLIHFSSNVPATVKREYATKFIECLLDWCPNLHNLKLFPFRGFYGSRIKFIRLDVDASIKLIKSAIKSLILDFNLNITLPANVTMINEKLTHLEISSPLNADSFRLLSKTFSNLNHLKVMYMDDKTLQIIWQYQVN